MSFAIIRATKYKNSRHLRNLANHNFRVDPQKVKPGKQRHDPEKCHLNFYIGAQNPKEEAEAIKTRIATCTRKPRPDANKVIELVMTASPAFFQGRPPHFAKKYLDDCLHFAREKFGFENVISAQMHFDEKTPHIHVKAVPLETSVRKTKHTSALHTVLNAKHYTDGQKKMIEFQDEFYAFVRDRGHDLERGISKNITGSEHQDTAQWYAKKDAELALKANALTQQHEANRDFLRQQKAELKSGFAALDELHKDAAKKTAELNALLHDAKMVKTLQTFASLGLVDEPGAYVPVQKSTPSPS